MRTTKLYDIAYDREFDAVVVTASNSEKGTFVVLDQTLFFPEEGGQSCDTGMLTDAEGRRYRVTDVQIREGVITHLLEREEGAHAPLAAGMRVHGVIDWERRFSNMQNHSGEHILSGLMHTLYGFDNVGFHLSDNTVTLDVNGQLTDDELQDLERRANEVVWKNVRVTAEYPEPEVLAGLSYRSKKELDEAVRIVTIEGVDVCACCAPHVSRTGEIGQIRILRVQHEKNKMRLFILCGRRALDYSGQMQREAVEISHMTNLPPEEIARGVKKLQDENAAQHYRLTGMQMKYMELRVREAVREPKQEVFLIEDELDRNVQRGAVNELCAHCSGYAGIFARISEEEYFYIVGAGTGIGAEQLDAREFNRELLGSLSGKGGGSARMVQGTLKAERSEIENYLTLRKALVVL